LSSKLHGLVKKKLGARQMREGRDVPRWTTCSVMSSVVV
jgi:ribosomal protein L39E